MAGPYLDSSNTYERSSDLRTITATPGFGNPLQDSLASLLVRGLGFSLDYDFESIPTNGKQYLRVTTSPNNYVMLVRREIVTDQERVFYKVYTPSETLSDATSIPLSKLRTDSTIDPETTAATVAAPTSLGDPFLKVPIFGAQYSGRRASGSESANLTTRLFAPDTHFVVEFENLSSESVYVSYGLILYEIPASLIPQV